jgi:hypothetical protein
MSHRARRDRHSDGTREEALENIARKFAQVRDGHGGEHSFIRRRANDPDHLPIVDDVTDGCAQLTPRLEVASRANLTTARGAFADGPGVPEHPPQNVRLQPPGPWPKCRTATAAGEEQRTLSVSGGRPAGLATSRVR